MDQDRSHGVSRVAKHRLSQVHDLRRFLGHARVFRDLNLSCDIEKIIQVQSRKIDSRSRHRSTLRSKAIASYEKALEKQKVID